MTNQKDQIAQEYDAYYMRHTRQLWRRKKMLAAGGGLAYGEWEPVRCAVWVQLTGEIIDLDFFADVELDEMHCYQLRPLPN